MGMLWILEDYVLSLALFSVVLYLNTLLPLIILVFSDWKVYYLSDFFLQILFFPTIEFPIWKPSWESLVLRGSLKCIVFILQFSLLTFS